jgi:transcription elongation factor GreA
MSSESRRERDGCVFLARAQRRGHIFYPSCTGPGGCNGGSIATCGKIRGNELMDDTRTTYLTPEGIKKLQEELDYLINIRRPEIAQQIADAKADGDLSENAGYDEAKNTQAFVEGRILTVKGLLSNAVVIHENGSKESVDVGSKVTIRDVEFGDQAKYSIVGSAEVDPDNGRISLRSPIGRALMGHRKGDRIEVQTPNGAVQFEILSID